MSDSKPLVEFLAVLIFKEANAQRVTEAPLSIRATHPEIAYQLALKRGAEEPDPSFFWASRICRWLSKKFTESLVLLKAMRRHSFLRRPT